MVPTLFASQKREREDGERKEEKRKKKKYEKKKVFLPIEMRQWKFNKNDCWSVVVE